jgi:hypothetical protein
MSINLASVSQTLILVLCGSWKAAAKGIKLFISYFSAFLLNIVIHWLYFELTQTKLVHMADIMLICMHFHYKTVIPDMLLLAGQYLLYMFHLD